MCVRSRRVPMVEQELLTRPEHLSSPPGFSGVHVTQSLVLYISFVDRCLSFLYFFIRPLCCLSFFDLRILITPLVSSISSYSYLIIFLILPHRNSAYQNSFVKFFCLDFFFFFYFFLFNFYFFPSSQSIIEHFGCRSFDLDPHPHNFPVKVTK